jgi:hypothetical protein
VRSEISKPNFCNSPWIRGAPQSGFAAVIFATSVRRATSVDGRPRRDGREGAAHRRRSHWRCQRTTVSGWTKITALRQSRQALASRIQKTRSRVRSCGRLPERFRTASCCRSARFSRATAWCPEQIKPMVRRKTTTVVSMGNPLADQTFDSIGPASRSNCGEGQ